MDVYVIVSNASGGRYWIVLYGTLGIIFRCRLPHRTCQKLTLVCPCWARAGTPINAKSESKARFHSVIDPSGEKAR